MMLHKGKTFTLERGTKVRVEKFLGAGGEGTTYKAEDSKTGKPVALKVFTACTPERVERTRYLVDADLASVCRLFHAPTDWMVNGSLLHCAPFADGVSLEEHLEKEGNSPIENCKILIALCHGHSLLEDIGLSHGDHQLRNLIVMQRPAGLDLGLIDFDNFIAADAPPPPCIGQEHMMAPELRAAYREGRPVLPDVYSDRFALAVLCHDVLLAKHVACGLDDDPGRFDAGMMSGRWRFDPSVASDGVDATGGYPAAILNADMARLFRLGLGLERELRPMAREWRDVVSAGYERVYVHPPCGGFVFADAGKRHCPFCGARYRTLQIVFPTMGRRWLCDGGTFSIGRSLLGSSKVSGDHARIYCHGPLIEVASTGRNGSYREVKGRWVRFDKIYIEAGDRLRFADVEAVVEEVSK